MRKRSHPAGIRAPLSLKPGGASLSISSISPLKPSFRNTSIVMGTVPPTRMFILDGAANRANSGYGGLILRR